MRELPEIPDELLEDMASMPIIPEGDIDLYVSIGGRLHGRNPRAIPLTDDELEVLRYLAVGLDYRMAADALGCAVDTAKQRAAAARFKLGAKNATHAVALAIRRKLIL